LVAAAGVGLTRDLDAGTLNDVAFATVHIAALSAGVRPALLGSATTRAADTSEPLAV